MDTAADSARDLATMVVPRVGRLVEFSLAGAENKLAQIDSRPSSPAVAVKLRATSSRDVQPRRPAATSSRDVQPRRPAATSSRDVQPRRHVTGAICG
jgi:hypothetical protein